jgi:hypothetical protein
MKQYLINLLMALDQLGNAIAGGDPDVTVSGRIGYNSFKSNHWYWKLMEWIVDFTFAPVDSPKHCYTTYLNDNDIDHSKGSTTSLIMLSLIAVPTCIILFPFVRILALFI